MEIISISGKRGRNLWPLIPNHTNLKLPGTFLGKEETSSIDLSKDRAAPFWKLAAETDPPAPMPRVQGKCSLYVGVELSPAAARIAANVADRLYTADIESFDLPEPAQSFDVLIASEVLEHLVDPWAVLKRLRPLLRPGALVFASSPNVAHHSMIRMLIKGRWDLEDSGRMDRTHLRWFTPRSYAQMFRDCGFEIVSLEQVRKPGPRARLINALTGGRLKHLFISQIVVVAKV